MRRLVILAALVLTACGTQPKPEPTVKTVIVHDATPVSCIPADMPPAPVYPDTRAALLSAPDAISRARLVEGGWGLRDARLTFLEQTVRNCAR